jgi:hypothetical protein
VFLFSNLLVKESSYWASSTPGLSERAVCSFVVRDSRPFLTGPEGIIKEGGLFFFDCSLGATLRASEAPRRHWSEQNREPVVSLPQETHFSNKVDICDSSDRLLVDESTTRRAENNDRLFKELMLQQEFARFPFILGEF